jgi:hypothetical protein
MERGALAIFGEADLSTSNSLRSFVNYYNVPFFTWSYPTLNDFNADHIEKKSELETEANENYENRFKKLEINKARKNSDDALNFLLNMHPSFTPVLVSLIKYNRWQTVYYVYDHDEGLLS